MSEMREILSLKLLFRQSEWEEKQQHFAFSPFEYLLHLLPLMIPMIETQKTPRMPMSEAVMLWTSPLCMLAGKLTIFQLLKAPFTGIFLVTRKSFEIFTSVG